MASKRPKPGGAQDPAGEPEGYQSAATLYQSLVKAQHLIEQLTFGSSSFGDYWRSLSRRAGLPAQYLYMNFLAIVAFVLSPGASNAVLSYPLAHRDAF